MSILAPISAGELVDKITILRVKAERIGDLRLDVVASPLHVELDGAAQEVLRIEVAENHVAI